MARYQLSLFLLLFALCCGSAALGAVYQVPGDVPTIGAGLALAGPGDVVEVACGEYHESGLFMSEGVTLRGAAEADACVTIHGDGGTAIWFTYLNSCRVLGITFKGCGASALRLIHADPIIENCHFEGNAFSDGGAIHMLGSAPVITDCTFVNNTASHAGGAVAMGDCAATITGCTFQGNTANYGGAIDVESGSALALQDCHIEGNTALYSGGGLFVWVNLDFSSVDVVGSTIMNNTAASGEDGYADVGCYLEIAASTLDPDFQDTFAGPGIISVDQVVATERCAWGDLKSYYR